MSKQLPAQSDPVVHMRLPAPSTGRTGLITPSERDWVALLESYLPPRNKRAAGWKDTAAAEIQRVLRERGWGFQYFVIPRVYNAVVEFVLPGPQRSHRPGCWWSSVHGPEEWERAAIYEALLDLEQYF